MTTATVRRQRNPRRARLSKRRLTWSRKLMYKLAIPVGMGIIQFFWRTCRVVQTIDEHGLEARLLRGEPAVLSYWHRHQLFCWRHIRRLIDKGARVGWLSTASVDGEAPAGIARRMGGGLVFRGSSSARGSEALRAMCKAARRDGVSLAVTPDGPRGPHSEFKPGIVKLAQLSGAPLVPLAYAARTAKVLTTWDRFVVPRPFTRIVLAAGEPLFVPRQLDDAGLEVIQREMERRLQALFEQAQAAVQSKQGCRL